MYVFFVHRRETDGASLPSTDAPKELLSLKEPYYELTRDAAILKAITRGVLPTLPEESENPPIFKKLWELANFCWKKKSVRCSMRYILASLSGPGGESTGAYHGS